MTGPKTSLIIGCNCGKCRRVLNIHPVFVEIVDSRDDLVARCPIDGNWRIDKNQVTVTRLQYNQLSITLPDKHIAGVRRIWKENHVNQK
jgi:hypothetical protein